MSLVSANKVETNTYELVVSIGAEDFKKGIDKIYKKTAKKMCIRDRSIIILPTILSQFRNRKAGFSHHNLPRAQPVISLRPLGYHVARTQESV